MLNLQEQKRHTHESDQSDKKCGPNQTVITTTTRVLFHIQVLLLFRRFFHSSGAFFLSFPGVLFHLVCFCLVCVCVRVGVFFFLCVRARRPFLLFARARRHLFVCVGVFFFFSCRPFVFVSAFFFRVGLFFSCRPFFRVGVFFFSSASFFFRVGTLFFFGVGLSFFLSVSSFFL